MGFVKKSFAPRSHPLHGYNNAMPYHRHIGVLLIDKNNTHRIGTLIQRMDK